MGLSTNTYTYAGGAQTFAVNFADGFIERAHVTVYVAGNLDGLGNQIYSNFTWNSDSEVLVTDTLAVNDEVTVERTVPKDNILVALDQPGALTRESISRNARQSLHAVHEVLDGRLLEEGDTTLSNLLTNLQARLDALEALEAAVTTASTDVAAAVNTLEGIAASAVARMTQTFSGDGTNAALTLPFTPASSNQITVTVGGAVLPRYAFTVAGDQLTPVSPVVWPIGQDNIEVTMEGLVPLTEQIFTTRGELVGWLATNPAEEGKLYAAGNRLYQGVAGATAIADMPNVLPTGVPTPEHFGAVGDGVADDTTPLRDAVSYSVSSEEQLRCSGVYETTATVPNVHNVKLIGLGSITRDGFTWPITPKYNDTVRLHVAVGGSDTNDGISSTTPLATIGRAMVLMQIYAPLLGVWRVSVGAGTYEAFQLSSLTNQEAPIYIDGVAVPYFNGIATAAAASTLDIAAPPASWSADNSFNGATVEIISGTGQGQTRTVTGYASGTQTVTVDSAWTTTPDTTSRYVIYSDPTVIIEGGSGTAGISVFEGCWMVVSDVKIQNYTWVGARVERGRLGLENVHIYNCESAAINQHGSQLTATRGIWDCNNIANSIGYRSFFNPTHALTQTAGEQLIIRNCAQYGLLVSEGSQGHLDLVIVQDCNSDSETVGLALQRGAGGANTKQMIIERCSIGVRAADTWFNNNIRFGDGADANTVNVRTSGNGFEFDHGTADDQFKALRVHTQNFNNNIVTGTTSQTTLMNLPSIRDWMISEGGDMVDLDLQLRRTTNVGTCAVAFYWHEDVGAASDYLGGITLQAGVTDSRVRFQFVWTSDNEGRSVIDMIDQGGNVAFDTNELSMSMRNSSGYLRVAVTPANAGDSVVARHYVYKTTLC